MNFYILKPFLKRHSDVLIGLKWQIRRILALRQLYLGNKQQNSKMYYLLQNKSVEDRSESKGLKINFIHAY